MATTTNLTLPTSKVALLPDTPSGTFLWYYLDWSASDRKDGMAKVIRKARLTDHRQQKLPRK